MCIRDRPIPDIKAALLRKVEMLREADIATCRKIGEYGLSLLKPGMGVQTHCNAGQFATIKYGTATAPIYLAHEQGIPLKVYADETRPLLQGARITVSYTHLDVYKRQDNCLHLRLQWLRLDFLPGYSG